ncbi:MAG: trimethylamine methyltransferase family protein, partial [Anaerolineales bacterium]|nr:trimethylamine methyltransferase family protein [Anaerolineales bacterium]
MRLVNFLLTSRSIYTRIAFVKWRLDHLTTRLSDHPNPMHPLTPDAIESIHQASLRILNETGVILTHPEGRERLFEAGARLAGGRVCLPPDLVEWALSQPPERFTLHGRDGKTATLGDGSLHWHNLGGARQVYEPEAGVCRPATLQDVRDSARLLDALDNVTTVTPFFTPQDTPGALLSLAMYRHSLPHTIKPLHGPGVQTAAEVAFIARLAAVIGPPGQALSLGISPISPLNFPDDVVAAILETARLGI